MKKLLVTGISGFLGWHVAHHEQEDYELVGSHFQNKPNLKNIPSYAFDLSNEKLTTDILDSLNLDAIIHLAANSNPNNCEQNKSSNNINVEATLILARWSAKRNIPFLFTSTDLVFDGKNPPYDESGATNPIMVYGQQKLEAEQKVLAIYPNAIIARMPLMYGMPANGLGFMNAWVRNLKVGKQVFCFTDEYRTILSGSDAAAGLFLLLEKDKGGIFHLGGKERISRFDFAIRMAEAFNLPKELIIPSLQKDVQMPAKRPADVSFVSEKAFALGFNPSRVEEELERLRN